MSRIDKETVDVFTQGHLGVLTTPAALSLPTGKAMPAGIKKGILLKAPGATDDTPNTISVFIGTTAAVTSDLVAATGGFPLAPGESVVIPVESINKIWVIAAAGSQTISWMVV